MLMRQQQQQSGLSCAMEPNDARPLIIIAGCGMSGIALALALQQRGMRAIIYEKDTHYDARSQGYGLTMQQVPPAAQ